MVEAVVDDERRMHLVRAAARAIDEAGPTVGMAQIADRAGLQRPNVYRLFRSKEQLDAEVARHASAEIVGLVRPALVRGGTSRELIRGVIAISVAWAAEHPNLYRFLAAQRQTRSLHRARTGRSRFLDEVVTAMQAYLRTKDVIDPLPDGVLAGLMGMIDASTLWWIDHEDETEDDMVDRLAGQVHLILTDLLDRLGVELAPDAVFRPLG